MIFRVEDADDGNMVITLDEEGIDWLERGLTQLREAEPGEELSCPSIGSDGKTGEPTGVSDFVLKRVVDG